MAKNPIERLIKKDHPDYEVIGEYISSKDGVVGFDPRHTHIIIIKKLIQLEQRLQKMNKRLKAIDTKGRKKKKA